MSDNHHRDKWDARYQSTPLAWSAEPNQTLQEIVHPLQPAAALDVACGEGRNACWLAQQGWTVTAFDFSSVAIAKARQIAAERKVEVTWQVRDATDPLDDLGQFELVTIVYLHTDAQSRATWLANVSQCVKPRGLLVYIGHDPRNIGRGTGGPQQPDVLPTAAQVTAALDNFEILRAQTLQRPVAVEPGHGKHNFGDALDTIVVAQRR